MYAAYFGLKQEPFSIAPDPRLLFMSEQHREALAHLLYGVQGGGGFVLLTGEIGTGKTTVCRSFLEQVPEHVNLAYIFNPKLTVLELLETVCHEFGVPVSLPAQRAATVKDFIDPLNAFLLRAHAEGRNNVLVIDEAQNLAPEVLEQLRLLTNLETSERKLLQVILIGQPELREMLARPELEQLAQRVIARYHLQALSREESEQYVRHRLEVCGLQRPLPFDRGALKLVHAASGGVPRRINLLCDRALLGAYANGEGQVTRGIVREAAAEVFPKVPRARQGGWPRTVLAAGAGLAVGAGLLAAVTRVTEPPSLSHLSLTVTPRLSATPAAAMPPAAPLRVAATAPARPPTLHHDENAAWRELAGAWKVALPEGTGNPCSAFAREQVHCFEKNLSLAVIRQLGRPGIVTLDADTGRPSYALLVGLNEQSATLQAAGTEQTVTLAALAQRWQGDFATLWRAPEGYRDTPRDGQGGAAVDWVAAQLASAQGTPAPRRPARLDAKLRDDVRAFQVAQGLPADGRPGPLTYMQLNRAAGVEEPRLRAQP
ncbi:AAA family ATPase [Ramlibacter sp. USB13]|uniref:AAA family ATPase n=1 Tax=Ramlibacter cellulosilyticus TaxID=2764187 RepID=A0A923MV84_9BURK|nr:ExeA family protein [Ramlibacter cellulosilyticus]MBC5785903.1 AAA family ATPase [Ramlibacter cellulosilyticus]